MKNHLINIQKIRLLRGYKQQFMAKKLGLSVQAYSQIERGKINLTTDKLEKIASVLQVEQADLLNEIKVDEYLKVNFGDLKVNYDLLKDELSFLKEENRKKDEVIAELLRLVSNK